MSTHVTLNFSLFDGVMAALVLLAGGGGVFAVTRRNRRRAQEADPEAIELDVTAAADDGESSDSDDNGDVAN